LLQVVHLVRDPRAVVASLAQQPDTWRRVLANVDKLCHRMHQDLQLNTVLTKDRFGRETEASASLQAIYLLA
jgi:hypothetical protein